MVAVIQRQQGVPEEGNHLPVIKRINEKYVLFFPEKKGKLKWMPKS
jgi:hypothetical protein